MQQIHWYPGHMAKAKRQMEESIKKVHAVLELVDSRLPEASSNPMIASLCGNKPRLRVMTRIDLADNRQTMAWIKNYREQGKFAIAVDAKSGHSVGDILPALEQLVAEKRQRDASRGIRGQAIRVMVAGIPNVGKSSLINRLAQRASTKTGDRPGVTQTQQWIRLGSLDLLDTPGVLWPKLEDQVAAYKLAVSGAIKSEILDVQELAAFLIVWLTGHYPEALSQRYQISHLPQVLWTNVADVWPHVEPVLQEIARRRGFLHSGGVSDLETAAKLLLREFQTGKLGRVSLEWPGENP